jgi:hypothetical protein
MGKSKLEQHAPEIASGLWLGGRWACCYAHEAGFKTIYVLESPCCGVDHCFQAPILVIDSSVRLRDHATPLTVEEYRSLIRIRCEAHFLKKAHRAIDKFLKTGPVLVQDASSRRQVIGHSAWRIQVAAPTGFARAHALVLF